MPFVLSRIRLSRLKELIIFQVSEQRQDKAGFTATVAIPAVCGEPMGKTDRALLVGPYPHALSMTHSESG